MIKKLTIVAVIFFVFSSIPIVHANTDYFSDSTIIIMGKCNTVSSTVLWLFGFKFVINKKIIVQTNGEGNEKIYALILPSKIGFYFSQENILIQMNRATGLFFWGEKSLFLQQSPQRILAICKAGDIWVSY